MKKPAKRTPKTALTPDELRGKASLTMTEARTLTGFGRNQIVKLCDAEDGLEFFWHGSHRRIVTDSIFDYQRRQAAKAKGA